MAQQVLVQLVDDVTGEASPDVATVLFGLDGAQYEIDLSEQNADRLREALAEYVKAGRRTGGRVRRGSKQPSHGREDNDAGKIREWANENGFAVSARGRIPGHVVNAYREAQAADQAVAANGAKRRSRRKH